MKLGKFLRRNLTRVHESGRRLAVYFDHAIWLTFAKQKSKIFFPVKNILVVLINEESGNVGGDFCILGVMNYLAQENPSINFSLLGDQKTLNRFGKLSFITKITFEGRETLIKIKKLKFDSAIFINAGPTQVKDYLFIKNRVGTFFPSLSGVLHQKNKLFLTRKVLNPWGTHMVDICFRMFEAVGIKPKERKTVFVTSKEDRIKVEKFLNKNKLRRFVIIHPGGKHIVESLKAGNCPPHLWNLDRYACVSDYFYKQGFKIVVTGTSDESFLAEKIKGFSQENIINACGTFTIRELGELLKKANLLIATDTSIVHVAYQIGTPIVELIGPSVPEVVAAWPLNSPRHKILIDNGPCHRSMKKVSCPERIPCLEKISVRDVINASKKLLAKTDNPK